MRKKLLSVSADSKTVKGRKAGYLTGILYLSPSTKAGGPNLCPFAKVAKCEAGCLDTAGRGVFNSTQSARIKKTRYFLTERAEFFRNLWLDIEALIRKAERDGLTPTVRLNGTSDIAWEREAFTLDGVDYANIFEAFPKIQFYDYTKDAKNRHDLPANYDLTFSLSGANGFARFNALALSHGMSGGRVP